MTAHAHIPDSPAAYRVETLAGRWECSPGHIYDMIRSGSLKSFRIGKLIRVHRAEVERVEGFDGDSLTGEHFHATAEDEEIML